jgi:FdhD protein
LAGRTGCGVCGIESLQALELLPAARPADGWRGGCRAAGPGDAAAASAQPLNAQAGAVHVAAWADLAGQLRWAREDVGATTRWTS